MNGADVRGVLPRDGSDPRLAHKLPWRHAFDYPPNAAPPPCRNGDG